MTPETLRRIAAATRPAALPEIRFFGLPEGQGLDRFRIRHGAEIGAAVPYWAVAWPGGLALARLLLDRPEIAAGRPVVDLGCGAGLVAIAAMKAGAATALAVDIDPNALVAAQENARLNRVEICSSAEDIAALAAPEDAVICAGDLWYDRTTGRRATAALHGLRLPGQTILAGDPGRPGRPRAGFIEVARYTLPVSTEFEAAPLARAAVYALAPTAILPAHCPHAAKEEDALALSDESGLTGGPHRA